MRRLADLLIESDSWQRPALAKRTSLPRQTVSDLMAELEMRGLVRVEGRFDGVPGRSNLSYALEPGAAAALAFNVARGRITGALTDMRGRVLSEWSEERSLSGVPALAAQIATMAAALCERGQLPRYRVRTCTMGLPGVTDPATRRTVAEPLDIGEADDAFARFQEALGCPLRIENDVNLALIGEVTSGQGRGLRSVAFIALGEGIGAGLMIDGRLLRGSRGAAGELGFLPISDGADALRANADFQQWVGASQSTGELAQRLARGIAALVAVADPELVVMGGTVGSQPDLVSQVNTLTAAFVRRPVPVVRTATGPRAGMVGALEVARLDMMTALFGEAETLPAW